MYLLVVDITGDADAFICKANVDDPDNLVFHEWVRLTDLTTSTDGNSSGWITVTNTTGAVNSPILLIGLDTVVGWIQLGRGGGRGINDSLYEFGAAWEFETGKFTPRDDLTLTHMLVGIKTAIDVDANESCSFTFSADDAAFANLLTTQEGSGTAPITNTSGYTSATRYAPVGTNGQFFNIKMSGTLSATQLGTDRPEIRELVAFGYTHSKVTDLITMQIYADRGHHFGSSRGRGEVRRQWSEWHNDGDILLIVIPGYEEGRSIRVKVVGVTELNLETRMGPGNTQDRADVVEVTIERIDYANSYANTG